MSRTALYRHFDADGRLLYIGVSDRLGARGKEHSAKAAWRDLVVRTEATWLESREAAMSAEIAAIAAERPLFNVTHRKAALSFSSPDPGIGLGDWLRFHNVGQADFARHIGVTPGPMSKFISGRALPSLETAVLIEGATDGAVKPASWVRAKAKSAAAQGAA